MSKAPRGFGFGAGSGRSTSRPSPYSSAVLESKRRRLKIAAHTNNVAHVRKLLDEGGLDPNSADQQRRTPLHVAASCGYLDVVRLLLKGGADPNVRDSLGNLPLHLAACAVHPRVVVELLEAGADPTAPNVHGRSSLQLAQSRLNMARKSRANGPSPESERFAGQALEVVDAILRRLASQEANAREMEALAAELDKVNTKEDDSANSHSAD